MEDEANPGRVALDDSDARILMYFGHGRFSSVHSIVLTLGLASETGHQRLAISLDMQPRHFRWVPHVLTGELRSQREMVSRVPPDVLRQPKKTYFRGIVTGKESWVFTDMAARSVWLWSDDELPTRRRRTKCADKRMPVVLLGTKGIIHVNWLPNDA